MILKHIYLYLNTLEYNNYVGIDFGFRTRYICNFIERQLKSVKFRANGFSKICVQGRDARAKDCELVPENALVSYVHFDRVRYERLTHDQLHEFFLAMLMDGFDTCRHSHDIPYSELQSAVSGFRAGGYVNEWVHKRKRLEGVTAELRCLLTMDCFVLSLSIARASQLLFSKVILTTKPDEIVFSHKFKDVSRVGDRIIVVDKFDKEVFAVQLPAIGS